MKALERQPSFVADIIFGHFETLAKKFVEKLEGFECMGGRSSTQDSNSL